MRLYRALYKDEHTLTSNERAFDKDGNITDDINVLEEIYGHVVKSHSRPYPKSRKIIFSFTDDIKDAYSFIEKYPESYDAIGYIDINEFGFVDQNGIKFVYPIYRLGDWVELLAKYTRNEETLEYIHVNYQPPTLFKKGLASSLLPSHNGVLSYAKTANEYAVIGANIKPIIIPLEEVEKIANANKVIESTPSIYLSNNTERKNIIIESIRRNVATLPLEETRRLTLNRWLDEYKEEINK